ncbi:MAG: tetratricopeptide repeat protein, partial [Candidatus Cybelea sp.]
SDLLNQYPDGVWFIDFAPISDPELVASVVAQVLGIRQMQGRRVDESILLWLKRKRLLLIFDNCEHILRPASALVNSIQATAQDLRMLVTSRERLNISGEATYRLPSLAVPAEDVGLTVDRVLQFGAVALFVDRATAADTRFDLSDGNVPIVAEICRRLDGIPLAIELAAARVTVLSIPNLAQRLSERFKILTSGRRTALPRQQTLTALIDWSYDLLTPQEQLLFARLGSFGGGFGLDAAVAVCGGEDLEEGDIFDLLASLTDKSLVIAETSDEEERFRLLESAAAYALEKLNPPGERERLARRHAEYFREQAEAAAARYGTGSTVAWIAGVELELDNYRAALEWALTRENDAVLGGAIAGALQPPDVGVAVEGTYWIELALPRVSEAEQPAIAARLQLGLSCLSAGRQRYEASERAMQLYESGRDLRGAARARRLRGWALYQMGPLDEAREATAGALAALRACGDTWGVAHCLNQLAYIESERGDLNVARELYAQALAGNKALGDEMGMSQVLGNMAESEFAMGGHEQALRLAEQALELASLGKNLTLTCLWHQNTAAYCIALGDFVAARESAREGLRAARQGGRELYLTTTALQHFALLAAVGTDTRFGAQLLGYVNAQYDQFGWKRDRTEQWSYDKLLAALRERLSDDEIGSFAVEGATWSEDRAVERALTV